jgi:hypothetical protein
LSRTLAQTGHVFCGPENAAGAPPDFSRFALSGLAFASFAGAGADSPLEPYSILYGESSEELSEEEPNGDSSDGEVSE